MTNTIDAESVLRRSSEVEDHLRVLIEHGLFSKSADCPDEIAAKIEEARSLVASDEAAKAATALTKAETVLHRRLSAAGRYWRASHVHQVPLFVFYVAVLVAVWWVGDSEGEKFGTPHGVVVFGSLGAVLRGVWFLHRQVARRIYRNHFLLAHLLAPVVGALLALLSFLLLKAGLVSIEGGEGIDLDSAIIPKAVAFLSGFSWEWAVERIQQMRVR